MDLTQIIAELGAYARVHNTTIRDLFYRETELDAIAETTRKVQDEYPVQHWTAGRVIRQFRAQFDPVNEPAFKTKKMKAYHQKADFLIIPSEIKKTWLASDMYNENLPLAQKSISRFVFERVIPKMLQSDLAYNEFKAVFNDGTFNFGESMNGLLTILNAGIADVNFPMYRIPLLALTDANIVDQVTLFERNIPKKLKGVITEIRMSHSNWERYKMQYFDQYGQLNDFGREETMRTPLGNRRIRPFHGMDGSDLIWASPGGNFRKLIDELNGPQITDIQRFDRTLKVFSEFTLGYDFEVNQLVLVGDIGGATRGLVTDHAVYYPEESTTPIT